MVRLTGYQILEQIYSGPRTLVYRGIREQDQTRVVIKLLRREYPSLSELGQFRNQYNITKNLLLPGILQTYSLENCHNGYALIMEDFGGISLNNWELAKNQVNLSDFFHIAMQIVTTLDGLYRHRIIHKDIKPANILINPTTQEVKLIDFGIASLLKRETPTLMSPNVLEGTLAYLSPEQTGRMNRGIDYRTDFYSLGVTFFELLTGQLPFCSDDPMELVHCHIAKLPPQVHFFHPAVPEQLSHIVSKLMNKNAEDRYQSALGLKHDLEICSQEWEAHGKIANFQLGSRDICDRFIIPEKLYGRQAEVETLLAAFKRVAEGSSEMILVAGFSGIGKTAVVNEIHKPIVKQRGYFIKGKYDQFQRNIPFSAILQAFRDLIGQLLSESDSKIQQWKAKILTALGEQGQVIIDVIPELERIIGKQPEVPEVTASAAQNRFNLLLQKFIQVFSNLEHPLVIFLDDLQWADSASLHLIQLLISQIDTAYLLLIGAYRDNEVSAAHPLMLTLQEIKKTPAIVNSFTLAPLEPVDLNHLITDTLNCQSEIALPLTELVFQKTQGNPFFANQFLKAIHNEQLITFNFELGYWQCNITEIRALSLTNNIVEFMALQLQKMPQITQEVLKLAACISNHFHLSTLAIICEKSPAETAADLWPALQAGLIIPTSEVYKFFPEESLMINGKLSTIDNPQLTVTYRFLHDRVQQAAEFLIPVEQKEFTHLKIGQLLLHNTPPAAREENIFEIVNQLNMGIKFITEPTERAELLQLNLIAGQKAKAATAYGAAIVYLNIGIALLEENCWHHQYDLALLLHSEAVEVAYLSTDFNWMDDLAQIVLQSAKSVLDKVKIYGLKTQACIAQNQLLLGIKTALPVLQLLGVNLPEEPQTQDIIQRLEAAKIALMGKKTFSLIELPVMTNPEKLAALSLLSSMFGAAYNGYPQMFPLIICEQVVLSVQYGNAPISAFSYASYGSILATNGDIDTGYEFGELALNLLKKLNAKELQAKTYCVVNCLIIHWKEHLQSTLPLFIEGYHSGWETGDLEWSARCAFSYCCYLYMVGTELTSLEAKIADYAEAIAQFKQTTFLNYLKSYHQTVLNLLGLSDYREQIKGEVYDEEIMLPLHQQASDRPAVYHLHINKLILCYLFGEYHQAIINAEIATQYLDGVPGIYIVTLLPFYDSLARLAVYFESGIDEQKTILEKVNANQAKIQQWAHYAPMNHLHKFYLVEAEKHRILGETVQAMDDYQSAITTAKQNQYLQEEALANELTAKFYLELRQEKIAQLYITDAYYAYTRWEAKAKIDDLEKRYAKLLAPIIQRSKIILNPHETISYYDYNTVTINNNLQSISLSNISISQTLDLATVIKASQALASEIRLDKLLSTLMQVLIENAGAKKSALILLKNGTLVIESIANVKQAEPNTVLQSIPVDESRDVPISIINYVYHSAETIVMGDAMAENKFTFDPYIQQQQPKSILCTPIIHHGKLIGILYLENNLTIGAFTNDHLQLIKLLTAQGAISLENAQLYGKLAEYSHNLQLKVEQRTQELQEQANQLELTLQKLYSTQSQLIHAEKMSSLGQMVAGIAHEINNPVSFIYGNLTYASEYITSLFGLISLYQQLYPESLPEIKKKIADIELDYIVDDLPKLLASMQSGAERIENIVLSLRNFSRLDESQRKQVDIHAGIDSTLLILQHRLQLKSGRYPTITVIKQYGKLPKLNCYASDMNQVFMSIISNAIEALQTENSEFHQPPTITITTEFPNSHSVRIRIADNGPGMSESVLKKIFDPFFTTKPVGSGTGLGLSMSYSIVVEKHGGKLTCCSAPGAGADFMIEIPIL